MNLNLEQDWIKFENLGATAYYGYNIIPNADVSSNTWAIRQMVGTGTPMSVNWANAGVLSYDASWTNRTAFFATPSNIGNVTASSIYDGSYYSVTYVWTGPTGASKYLASFVETASSSRPIFNISYAGDSSVYNPNNNSGTITLINQTSVTLNRCRTGYTYSLSLVAFNGVGSVTASKSISI